MLLKSTFRTLRRRQIFRRIRKGKRPIHNLPPYERGLYYEDFVCRWLTDRGYRILDRNYIARKRREIDIVAKERDTLVFLEVKARRRMSVYTPLRAIDPRKRQALASAASDYLQQLRQTGVDTDELKIRYDVVALTFDSEGVPVAADHYISYLEPKRERI